MGSEENVKSKCNVCGTMTNKKNRICVLCENGITVLYEDLLESLKKDKNVIPLHLEIEVFKK